MANFGHGGNAKEISRENKIDYDKIIDFSANINPLGMPSSVKKDIIDGIDKIEKYPDITYFELKSAIGEYENINKENLLLGNGAAEVLFNVVRGINPKNVLIMAPTFSEYEEASRAVNANVSYYKLKEENDFIIDEDILEYLDSNLDLIFICNPNNPTGVLTEKDLLIKILIKAKKEDIDVVIDESFLDFIEENLSMISYINQFQNLIIIKSLTKFFSLPGIRIGYAICSNKCLKEKIENISPAWNINILAEIAAKSGMKDENYIEKSKKFIKDEREFLYNRLIEIRELKVYESSVNFIFFKSLVEIDLKAELLEDRILIRSCSNYEGLDAFYYRIAVRTREENIKILKSIRNIFDYKIYVTMKTKKNIYELGTKEVIINITNNGQKEVYYGLEYLVEKFDNNKWIKIPFKEEPIFNEIEYILEVGKTNSQVIPLSNLKELTIGKYRVVKSNGDWTAEFEIK